MVGEAILYNFIDTLKPYIKNACLKQLTKMNDLAEHSHLDSARDLSESDKHLETGKKLLFNVVAIDKIEKELRIFKARIKNRSINHSANDFKKKVTQWMIECSSQKQIQDELDSSSSSLSSDTSALSALIEQDEG